MKVGVKLNIRNVIFFLICILIIIILSVGLYLMNRFNLMPDKIYTAEDFGIEQAISSVDYNNNGTDDYTDLLIGAQKDAQNHPKYDSSYYSNSYPPDNIGVCTDVVWRAFRNAGYCLRDMVDNDIKKNPEEYFAVNERDKNIDFRRVRNLRVFFDKYAEILTTDEYAIAEWQAGDIVIFGDNSHIGIVSDKRNRDGRTYIIHNGGQPNREEDYLKRADAVRHYRFDASKISEDVLVQWYED